MGSDQCRQMVEGGGGAARESLDRAQSVGASSASGLVIGEPFGAGALDLRGVCDHPAAARLEYGVSGLLLVFIVRPEDHGHGNGGGVSEVLTAARRQHAASDEHDRRAGIKPAQLAPRVK